jgi:hypothetical protein
MSSLFTQRRGLQELVFWLPAGILLEASEREKLDEGRRATFSSAVDSNERAAFLPSMRALHALRVARKRLPCNFPLQFYVSKAQAPPPLQSSPSQEPRMKEAKDVPHSSDSSSSHSRLHGEPSREVTTGVRQVGEDLTKKEVDKANGRVVLSQAAPSPFKLSEAFVSSYTSRKAPFGFNGLGELVYHRTYSRVMENGQNEQWKDTVQRVVEGTFAMQKGWMSRQGLVWNEEEKQMQAEEMFERIFT